MEKEYIIHSNAKINIYIEILGKRNDGFHNIFSIFIPISWYDELIFTQTKETTPYFFHCNDKRIIKNNTVLKACELLLPYKKIDESTNIKLNKKVPYEAGLGSASANGTHTLMFLNQLWKCNLTLKELYELSTQISSDSPFFLFNQPCIVEGRGDLVTPIKVKNKFYLVIVKPTGIQTPTPFAYSLIAQNKSYTNNIQQQQQIVSSLKKGDKNYFLSNNFNGFQELILNSTPQLIQIKNLIYELGAKKVLMSGSGPTLVGYFKDESSMNKALLSLEKKTFPIQVHSTIS